MINEEEFKEACKCMYIPERKIKDISDNAKRLICYFYTKLPYGTPESVVLEECTFSGSKEALQELLDKKIITQIFDKNIGKIIYC